MVSKKSAKTVGRPTKFDPKYIDELFEHMERGGSYKSFAGRIRVCFKTLYNWEAFPEWANAKEIGEAMKLYHDEQLLISGAKGEIENFNAASAIFTMKAQHGWTDRIEVKGHVVVESWEQYLLRLKKEQGEAIEVEATPLLGEDHHD